MIETIRLARHPVLVDLRKGGEGPPIVLLRDVIGIIADPLKNRRLEAIEYEARISSAGASFLGVYPSKSTVSQTATGLFCDAHLGEDVRWPQSSLSEVTALTSAAEHLRLHFPVHTSAIETSGIGTDSVRWKITRHGHDLIGDHEIYTLVALRAATEALPVASRLTATVRGFAHGIAERFSSSTLTQFTTDWTERTFTRVNLRSTFIRRLVLDAIGSEISAFPDPELVRLSELYPSRDQLDVFIEKLRPTLGGGDSSANNAFKSIRPDYTVRDVIDLLAMFVHEDPKEGGFNIRLGDLHAESGTGLRIENIRVSGDIKIGDIVGSQIGIVGGDIVTGDKRGITTHSSVRVFYATDRKEVRGPQSSIAYGSKRSDAGCLSYGECTVSIPQAHKVGRLESPSLLRLEFRPDPEKHIALEAIQALEEAAFFRNVSESVARAAAKDAFVFVHGYNVSFEDAARRTGQIAFDLHFVGAPIFYSWPSNGKVADYLKDETNVTWTAPHFERFLGRLSKHSGAARVHIIAHSMGNRAVCEALKHIAAQPQGQLKFNHLVLAAPDIDADTFQELADTLKQLSGRITLYESSNDKAIRASKKIHGSPRAGEPLPVIPGLDTVDASAVDTDFLAHSYFSDNWPLLSDIHSILAFDKAPGERFGLAEMTHALGRYYAFRPT